jgi:hypothetical protein
MFKLDWNKKFDLHDTEEIKMRLVVYGALFLFAIFGVIPWLIGLYIMYIKPLF